MQGIKQAVTYGIVILIVVVLFAALPLYVDWLWFHDLGYGGVFSTILGSRILLGFVTGLVFFLVVWGSAWYALRSNAGRLELYTMDVNLPIFLDRMIRRGVEFIVLLSAIVISMMAGLEASTHWQSWVQFSNYVPFNVKDPVFNIDIGFYVFRLDFIQFVYRTVLMALIAAGIAAAAILYLTRTVDLLAGKLKITGVAAGHLGIILALIALVQAVGFRLGAYELLFTQGPALFGMGYADVHVRLLAQNLAIVATIIGAGIILLAARRRSLPLAIIGLFLGMAVQMVVGQGGGAIVQRFVVNPDELAKETPYLERHIEATQSGYQLQDVNVKAVDVSSSLTPEELQSNDVTLKSVRLWDYRPLQESYAQLQDIQQYYTFNEVDIDRYNVEGVYRQVMLSPREIDQDALPAEAKTWVNTRLKYTHGYGIAMSPVNEVSEEGLPRFFIKDIPPQSPAGFNITQPQIYFGENTHGYVLVNTDVEEFDYPKGSEGVYTKYKGNSGVEIGGFLRRALLATRFGDINITLSGNINPDSRILFRRNIQDRIGAIAPFLRLDADPYIVTVDGKVYWMQDAYTTSGKYPYSQPSYTSRSASSVMPPDAINYIRNSVKVVIDAYTGETTFYAYDDQDPIVRSWGRAFPGMFKPRSEMPEDLQAHTRYPENLFRLQTLIYQTYHMSNVQQYYNKGDLWAIPELELPGQSGEGRAPMEPYYIVMRLPDSQREEFILLMPFRRADKDNMVAWMAAKCDEPDYGQLILYEFPKGEQFYGPAQIQSRANQNTEISEQMTLWNQQKSNVVRGNLLVIPIEDAVLYVEPIYLQSTQARIPEFKRVIVALGDEITMQPSLEEALEILVGGAPRRTGSGAAPQAEAQASGAPAGTAPPAAGSADMQSLRRALDLYRQGEQALKQGDWETYGQRQRQLGDLLGRMAGQQEASD